MHKLRSFVFCLYLLPFDLKKKKKTTGAISIIEGGVMVQLLLLQFVFLPHVNVHCIGNQIFEKYSMIKENDLF